MADEYVKRSELPEILKTAVREALNEYQHECVLNLRNGDSEHARELFQALREIGHGNLGDGITEVRENHTFIMRYRKWACNTGGLIITVIILALAGFAGSSFISGAVSALKAALRSS